MTPEEQKMKRIMSLRALMIKSRSFKAAFQKILNILNNIANIRNFWMDFTAK